VTDHEGMATDEADPSPPGPPLNNEPPAKRPWWKGPIAATGVGVGLTAVAVGGYFTVNVILARPSTSAPPPPASSIDDPVPGLPPGALNCPSVQTDTGPFNSGARGTPATSCEFVQQVSMAYSKHTPTPGPDLLTVVSPATSKQYHLVCLSIDGYATCTGGAAAVIYLYNK
jgi:hypothetical protein